MEYKHLELLGFCSVYQNQEVFPAYLCNYYEIRAVSINNAGKYLKYVLTTIFIILCNWLGSAAKALLRNCLSPIGMVFVGKW